MPRDTRMLAKHYPQFSADERFRLLLSAACRKDDVELQRLSAAAPRLACTVSDTFAHTNAMLSVANHHLAGEIELCVHTREFEAAAVVAEVERDLEEALGLAAATDTDPDHHPGRIRRAAGLLRLVLTAHRGGWERFAREMGADPDAALWSVPGRDTVDAVLADPKVPAATPEEAAALIREHDPEAADRLPTAESVAASLHQKFRAELDG